MVLVYLINDGRVGSFQTKASELSSAARTYIIENNAREAGIFSFNIGSNDATWKALNSNEKIDAKNVLSEDLIKSPFGNNYEVAYIIVLYDDTNGSSFSVFLSDGEHCFKGVDDSLSTECKGLIQK